MSCMTIWAEASKGSSSESEVLPSKQEYGLWERGGVGHIFCHAKNNPSKSRSSSHQDSLLWYLRQGCFHKHGKRTRFSSSKTDSYSCLWGDVTRSKVILANPARVQRQMGNTHAPRSPHGPYWAQMISSYPDVRAAVISLLVYGSFPPCNIRLRARTAGPLHLRHYSTLETQTCSVLHFFWSIIY